LAVPELTRSADIKPNERISLRRHAEGLSLSHRTFPDPPWQSRQAIIFRVAAFVLGRAEQAWQQRIMVSPDCDHLDTMSTAKHDEAPTTNFDTPGRAKKLKAVCLQAGFAIVVLIAMAGWLYFLARLVLSLATWIFG
jgi:hypothetical protein